MPHIALPEGVPGIRGPMMFRPETAKPMNELVDVLLRGPHTLSPGERELIGAYVSARNDCVYCHTIHGAVAAHHLGGNEELVGAVKRDFEHAGVSDKLKALLAIAGECGVGGLRDGRCSFGRAPIHRLAAGPVFRAACLILSAGDCRSRHVPAVGLTVDTYVHCRRRLHRIGYGRRSRCHSLSTF
jgi:AhpD family alkylhydroperoxidase